MRYVSDASYWVYLLHLPLTLLIPGLIADWPLPATLKMLFVVLSTTSICFVSYHYMVRGTFIGKFLNGRKYSRKLSDIKQPEASVPLKNCTRQIKPVANSGYKKLHFLPTFESSRNFFSIEFLFTKFSA
jgi:hypothetical protein